MSWHSEMTATQKAMYIGLSIIFEDIDSKLRFPLPRGAYSYREHPEWYNSRPLHEIVLSSGRE